MNTQYANQNTEKMPNTQSRIPQDAIGYSALRIFSGFGFAYWLFVSMLLFFFLATPGTIHAAEGWTGLVPACGTRTESPTAADGSKTTTYTPCSTCDFVVLVKQVLDFVWKYVALAGVALMLMVGGFQMITGALGGSATAHQKGLATIKNAFIGLAIVLFAWLAIDTIIKFIAQQSLTSGGPAELFQDAPGAPIPDPDNSISSTEVAYGFWNQIKCTKLEPVKVVTKPPPKSALGGTIAQALGSQYVCPEGVTSHIANGIDVCDPIIKQNLENNAKNPEGSTFRTSQGKNICIDRALTRFSDPINEWTKTAQFSNEEKNMFQALLIKESSGRENPPINSAGVVGLGQVLPSTARENSELKSVLGGMTNLEVRNWLKIGANNVRASVAVLKDCMNRNSGNRQRALACYNGGQYANADSVHCNGKSTGATRWECPYDSFKSDGKTSCWPATSSNECRKNTGYQETRDYVPAIEKMAKEINDGKCDPLKGS